MAAVSEARPRYNVLTRFEVLIAKISQEISPADVKIIKALIVERVNIQEIEKIDTSRSCPGGELFVVLRKYRLITENNLELLKDILKVTENGALLKKLEDFEKTSTKLVDASQDQMEMTRKDGKFVDLYLVISCKREQITKDQINKVRQAVERQAIAPLYKAKNHIQIVYLSSCENESDKETSVLVFQFPKDENEAKITQRLNKSALEKELWLKKNNVLQLKVNGNSSINLNDSPTFAVKYAEQEYSIVRNDDLQVSDKNVVDITLLVEMPHSVTPHACKEVINTCHTAVQDIISSKNYDINLSIIQYGNHTVTKQDHVHLVQDFCKEFSVKSVLQMAGQCGAQNGANSGMADALTLAVQLVGGSKVRSNASKLCILIGFPSSKTLSHYKSHNPDNDVFKAVNKLAALKTPLYIFGSDNTKDGVITRNQYIEDLFLSGLARVGGGRYFKISNGEKNSLPSDVIRHHTSIENNEELVSGMVATAIHSNYGDTNDAILARDVVKNINFDSSMFVQLLQNGRVLDPVHQVAMRLSFCDDIDEAIEAVDRIENKEINQNNKNTREAFEGPGLLEYLYHDHGKGSPVKDADPTVAKVSQKTDDPCIGMKSQDIQDKICQEQAKGKADLEMASRFVRMHLHRLMYIKNP